MSFTWTLPLTCSDPQKAIDVLSLLYTDADFINLIGWGIEGRHYVKIPGGENMITYPEGINAGNTGWDMFAGRIWGNQLASYVWEGSPPDLYEQMDQFNRSGVESKALGFLFDPHPVSGALTSVRGIMDEYRLGLEYGLVDPDVVLPRFTRALENAGINEVIAEKQRQLNIWADLNG
jgi:putative aldouronate transport system substrate-binding protein